MRLCCFVMLYSPTLKGRRGMTKITFSNAYFAVERLTKFVAHGTFFRPVTPFMIVPSTFGYNATFSWSTGSGDSDGRCSQRCLYHVQWFRRDGHKLVVHRPRQHNMYDNVVGNLSMTVDIEWQTEQRTQRCPHKQHNNWIKINHRRTTNAY